MAIDPRRRAKQLARKAAKHKEQLVRKRRSEATVSGRYSSGEIMRAAACPLHECLLPENLFGIGIGHILVSRRLGKRIAVVSFLVDVYCLGVKDALFATVPAEAYDLIVERSGCGFPMVPIDPACARKLVEGAVAYAQNLGLRAHEDYEASKLIFGDIDVTACTTAFEFGKDGKPLFVSGPHDTSARCNLILAALEKHCGPKGFHYVLGPPGVDLDEGSSSF